MNPDISTENTIEPISIERIDDIPLLVALQQKIGIADVIDRIIPRHWLQQGFSLGQLVLGWNTFILSEGDHRKVSVRDWSREHRVVLEELIGSPIRDTDFTDDRLGQVLHHLSDDESWYAIEDSLWQNSVSVYSLSPDRVRLDATNANGYHTVTEESIMQIGYNSKNNPLPQVKVMAGSVDCGINGHLVATEVVSGQKADDRLYAPVLERLRNTLQQSGLLYLGDSKMGAKNTRADIAQHGDFYLVPLAKVGEIKQLLEHCVETIVSGTQEVKAKPTLLATLIYDAQKKHLIAAGRLLLSHNLLRDDSESMLHLLSW